MTDRYHPASSAQRSLFGLQFDDVDRVQALDRLDEYIRSGEPHLVFCANVSALVMWRRTPLLRRVYRETDLLTVDGMALYYASRLLRTPVRQSVSGSFLFWDLLGLCESRGYRVFLLGARQEVLGRAESRLARLHPALRVVGSHHGYFSHENELEIAEEIRETNPDVLLLGMSSPLKERFAWTHRERMGVPVALGVGGMFDIAAGLHRRAPAWVQVACLEWLWRMGQEPRRLWKRYATTNSVFLALLARELIRGGAGGVATGGCRPGEERGTGGRP
ncbi:MAG: N-acetylglucosaminyldiphosphoundecaprenol N-acetyl-beta-D-mannosaminyltransferase [Actinomycetota bacterium]|nr:N-acetylglucosaminyldiphosphoundecaprenol N-acetyl-beta-D-mannosaminyltransferase [Actinomycetota bacterium]